MSQIDLKMGVLYLFMVGNPNIASETISTVHGPKFDQKNLSFSFYIPQNLWFLPLLQPKRPCVSYTASAAVTLPGTCLPTERQDC